MSSEEALQRAEELMKRLEGARAELEATSDPDKAIEVLTELAQIARDVEAALTEAKREADAEA